MNMFKRKSRFERLMDWFRGFLETLQGYAYAAQRIANNFPREPYSKRRKFAWMATGASATVGAIAFFKNNPRSRSRQEHLAH